MNQSKLNLIHKSLSEILVLLRDNPKDLTNPQMFDIVDVIMVESKTELRKIEDDSQQRGGHTSTTGELR